MPLPYFPVVRTKAGEVDALFNLSAGAKAKTFPIVRMTTTVPATFLVKMTRDLVGFPISLDGANNVSETGTTTAYTALFTGLETVVYPSYPQSGTPTIRLMLRQRGHWLAAICRAS